MLESLLRAVAALVQSLEPGKPLCVLAARLMHDWLNRNGIENAVLPARVSIWNEALMEREASYVSIGYGYPNDRNAPFGYHPARDSYNGHLIVRVGDIILDPTLGQASNPALGILAGPLLARVSKPAFFAGITEFTDLFRWAGQAPVHVAYRAEPTDLSYRRTYHWNDPWREELLALLDTPAMGAASRVVTAFR